MNTQPLVLPRGPLMLDVAGHVLTDAERRRLRDPRVGGVILFARNFASSAQLAALTAELHALRDPPLIIAVDHEGGRVQRFRNDRFTVLPPMRALGELHPHDPQWALALAHDCGRLIACELIEHGIDLSFAPVLDLDFGVSRAIGSRAFHRDPQVVEALAGALIDGLASQGMGAVGKHFPGHGAVEADSHHEIPRDLRPLDAILDEDCAPYAGLAGKLAGVMPAHVIFPEVDPHPAGFSPLWLGEILRGHFGFAGLIFSDDLVMEAASVAGDIVGRVAAAEAAGCDMLLVCNRPDLADEVLARWTPRPDPARDARLADFRRPPAAGQAEHALRQRVADFVATLASQADGSAAAAATIGNATPARG